MVVGDITPDQVLGYASTALGHEPNYRPDPCPRPPEEGADRAPPLVPGGGWTSVEADVDEPTVLFGWTTPGGTRAAAIAETAATLMNWSIADATGIDEAGCSLWPKEQLAVVVCWAPVQPADQPAEVAARAAAAFRKTWRLASQLTAAQAVTQARRAASAEWINGWRRQMDAELLDASPYGYLERTAVLFHRTWAIAPPPRHGSIDVAELGLRWLSEARMRGVLLVPLSTSDDTPALHAGRGREVAHAVVDPETIDAEALERVSVQPDVSRIRTSRSVEGMPMWFVEVPGLQRTHVALVYPLGPGQADPLARATASSLLASPYATVSRSTRRQAFESQVWLTLERDSEAWAWVAAGADAMTTTDVLVDAASARFALMSRDEARTEQESARRRRSQYLARPDSEATRLRWEALADGLPHPWLDDARFASMVDADRKAVRAVAASVLDPSRAILVAVTPPGASGTVGTGINTAARFGGHVPYRPSDAPLAQPALPRAVIAIDGGRQTQATLTLQCHVDDSDGATVWVLRELLEEQVADVLRGALGATYGVHVWTSWPEHGPTLNVHTQVAHDASGEAVATVLDAVERIGRGEVDAGAVARVKVQVARATATRWQTGDQILGLIRGAVLAGVDPREMRIGERLASVDATSLATALGPCVGHEVATLVGDRDAVGAALDARGIPWTAR